MLKRVVLPLFVIALLIGLYCWLAVKWSYSSGERAGWVQKLSNKGWLCKTWEGELAQVSLPGAAPEKFLFTVWDDAVAKQVTQVMGKRVALHYEEKVGLPGSCFGETRHYVTKVTASDEIPLAAGVMVPSAAGAAATAAANSAATAAATAAANSAAAASAAAAAASR